MSVKRIFVSLLYMIDALEVEIISPTLLFNNCTERIKRLYEQ